MVPYKLGEPKGNYFPDSPYEQSNVFVEIIGPFYDISNQPCNQPPGGHFFHDKMPVSINYSG